MVEIELKKTGIEQWTIIFWSEKMTIFWDVVCHVVWWKFTNISDMKMAIFILTAVRTSNPIFQRCLLTPSKGAMSKYS
jgi:hypothetical protein